MQSYTPASIIGNYLKWWDAHTRQVNQIHDRFLDLRMTGLHQLASFIEQQVESSRSVNTGRTYPLFTLDDLNEFATGSIVKCLGQEYEVYAGRRSLRIPNNELLLMSRILSIQGRKGEFDQTSSIIAEYDVPADAWYFEGDPPGWIPYSICLEVALQPCGVLSAYLGTPLRFPEVDYYFRNLDGETVFHRLFDARSKTIRTRAKLLKTIYYGTTIIQHFSFDLMCDSEVFFEGTSSFGYFSTEAMAGQTGLDTGKTVLPWLNRAGLRERIVPIAGSKLNAILPKGRLHLLDGVATINGGGDHGEGYVFANRRNTPQDWFYACHFHEDPVMPGSLGIEAIFQAIKIYISQLSNNSTTSMLVAGQKMNWRYRGQVLQSHQQMQVEVHFHKAQSFGKTNILIGDASLWADDSRIYEVRDIPFAVEEKQD